MHQATKPTLSRSPLFEGLSLEELKKLEELSTYHLFEANEVIVEEGARGDALYVIEQGEVNIYCTDRFGTPKVITTLRKGQSFGEMSVIDKGFRSASVKAATPGGLFMISSEKFRPFAQAYRDGFTLIIMNIAHILTLRLREANRKLAEHL